MGASTSFTNTTTPATLAANMRHAASQQAKPMNNANRRKERKVTQNRNENTISKSKPKMKSMKVGGIVVGLSNALNGEALSSCLLCALMERLRIKILLVKPNDKRKYSCVASNKSPRTTRYLAKAAAALPVHQKLSPAEQQYESYVQATVAANAKSPVEQLVPPPPPPRRHVPQPHKLLSPSNGEAELTDADEVDKKPLLQKIASYP
ncbi:unnamed protein product [Ceratitis capitata]|uniref:(Mediterranean fruit fly) hypothetical protein n=1 Tax=Ceratitis capitata TaxID=7213 RepID=A0A811VF66_CERCA|nr:unnamed protein product [Ceratitis capitata]